MNASPKNTLSLTILGLLVLALLAPYAGCNGLGTGSETSPSAHEQELESPSRKPKASGAARNEGPPVDPLEEILSN